jgi:hypothetical protein
MMRGGFVGCDGRRIVHEYGVQTSFFDSGLEPVVGLGGTRTPRDAAGTDAFCDVDQPTPGRSAPTNRQAAAERA